MIRGDPDASADDRSSTPTVDEHRSAIERRLEASEGLLLCLDFDGTLAPIVSDPTEATVPEPTERALRRLAERPEIDVAIVSGRSLPNLRVRVDVSDVTLAGNHGLEIERGERLWVHPVVERGALERIRSDLERQLVSIPGCYLEDKRVTATVHYRRASSEGEGKARALVERAVDGVDEIETVEGKEILEIRPAVEWDKGSAVSALMGDETLTIYAGDDETDEDAFRELDGTDHIGVAVGEGPTAADYRVRDPDDLRELLEWLAEVDIGKKLRAGGAFE